MNPENQYTHPATGEKAAARPAHAFDATDTTDHTKTSVTQAAKEAAAKVKSAVGDTVTRAKDEVERMATDKKESTIQSIGGYSEAIHESARSLEEKDPNIAWFTHRAADKLQSVADYMRQRNFADLRRDVEGVARRNPAVFFGGLFVAGLILGNVVKASRRTSNRDAGAALDEDDASDWGQGKSPGLTHTELSAAERTAAGL